MHALEVNFMSLRVGAAAVHELGFKRAAHQRQDIPEHSAQRAVKSHWRREGGREREKEPIGGSRGISGPARSHTSLSPPFSQHRIPAFARRIRGQGVNGLLRFSKHSLTHSLI
ncbi:uncharacterized [Tachysurus ichikawai]